MEEKWTILAIANSMIGTLRWVLYKLSSLQEEFEDCGREQALPKVSKIKEALRGFEAPRLRTVRCESSLTSISQAACRTELSLCCV